MKWSYKAPRPSPIGSGATATEIDGKTAYGWFYHGLSMELNGALCGAPVWCDGV